MITENNNSKETIIEHKKDLTFSEILNYLKQGYKAKRFVWLTKYIWIREGGRVCQNFADPKLQEISNQTKNGIYFHDCLFMKLADDSVMPGYVPSQEDLIAEDWIAFD